MDAADQFVTADIVERDSIHEWVEEYQHLRAVVQKQNKEIKDQEEQIRTLTEKIDTLTDIVHSVFDSPRHAEVIRKKINYTKESIEELENRFEAFAEGLRGNEQEAAEIQPTYRFTSKRDERARMAFLHLLNRKTEKWPVGRFKVMGVSDFYRVFNKKSLKQEYQKYVIKEGNYSTVDRVMKRMVHLSDSGIFFRTVKLKKDVLRMCLDGTKRKQQVVLIEM